ncbi:restriction endonuclease [Candidatus Peribacteria bacterium RIFCSPHIGHO2_02_FULL_53_20]|nr:MAG: restriction endonuclease [Candidatus Peribacteria bacterium RIFCSPHIGHO2_02_FULL_53_20]
MTKEQEMKQAIQSVIKLMMDRVMRKVLVEDPFIKEDHMSKKPLYSALVPDEIFKGSHFERRFVTPFGDVWEKLAIVAANKGLGLGLKGHNIIGKINSERLRRIQEILSRLEHAEKGRKRIKPDWENEIKYILAGKSKKIVPVTVRCDVYAENRKNRKKYAFEIKAPLPNSDQTKVSKEKIFKLYSMEPCQIDAAYYALPYNPYGTRQDYSWSFPARWFDMKNDKVVLIGDEFWERIGGLGTYKAFITAINEIGKEYKDRIYREFLGIEPPEGALDEGKL